MTNLVSPEAIAVSHFLVIEKLMERARDCVEDRDKENVGKPLRSRLREAPSIMLSTGTAGLLTFYLSKSDNTLLPALIRLLDCSINTPTGREAEKLVNDLICKNTNQKITEEMIKGGKGYTIALAMILSYLNTLGLCTCKDKNVVSNTASFAKDLLEKPGLDAATSRLLLPYLEASKRLVEAIVKGEER